MGGGIRFLVPNGSGAAKGKPDQTISSALAASGSVRVRELSPA